MILVYTEQKFEIIDGSENVVEQHADITGFYREGIKYITRNTFTIYTRFHTGPEEKTVEITPEVVNFVTNLVKDAMLFTYNYTGGYKNLERIIMAKYPEAK